MQEIKWITEQNDMEVLQTFAKDTNVIKYIFKTAPDVVTNRDIPEAHNIYYFDEVAGDIKKIINPVKKRL